MKAYGERVLIKPQEKDKSDVITGTVVSVGGKVPDDIYVGQKVVIGEYSGQFYQNFIIVNCTEILLIE